EGAVTEEGWQAAVEPMPMLASLPETTSARKLRLFACGCCRRIWHLVDDPRCRGAVATAEGYADGWRDDAQLLAANEASYGVYAGTSEPGSALPDAAVGMSRGSWEAAQAATLAAMLYTGGPCEAIRGAQVVAYQAEQAAAFCAHQDQRPSGFGDYLRRVARLNEQAEQADLLRDILGNPFCPAALVCFSGGLGVPW
ncbi:hypothetical protein R5W24_005504, partial [Gemmata sp. JC717]|uniref:hypothetical protein n=1 Tax=Gemmata algarum TaxID=2975278 RepID=UPI0021BA8854